MNAQEEKTSVETQLSKSFINLFIQKSATNLPAKGISVKRDKLFYIQELIYKNKLNLNQ